MTNDLISVKDVLASVFSKIEPKQSSELSLPPREKRLPDTSVSRLRDAIGFAWDEKPIYGPWVSGSHGFEPGELIDIDYSFNHKLTKNEALAIANEARRQASKAAIAEHIAILAAHKKYTGSDGFTFVMADIINHISHFSELAVKNAMDYLKMQDDSPWFPPAREIVRQCEWEQKKIDRMANAIDL